MCDRTERAVAEILNTTKNHTKCVFLWGRGSLSRYFWVSERLFRGLDRSKCGTLNLQENCWFDVTDNLWKTMHKKCA